MPRHSHFVALPHTHERDERSLISGFGDIIRGLTFNNWLGILVGPGSDDWAFIVFLRMRTKCIPENGVLIPTRCA